MYNSSSTSRDYPYDDYPDEDEDDIYDGFNYDADPISHYDQPVQASRGMPPGTSISRAPGTQLGSRMVPGSRLMTGAGPLSGGVESRPMTSVAGAGYQSQTASRSKQFDPLNQALNSDAPALEEKEDNSVEDRALKMEAIVKALLEKSAEACAAGNFLFALEKAKEAAKKERRLCVFREQNGLGDMVNLDLSYSVNFNLGNVYYKNDMVTEALDAYTMIVKNKDYAQPGRLRVNMGNIYFDQQQYSSAVKMYKMALDQIPNTNKHIRFKILRNIGITQVKLHQYQEAIQSFEAIMAGLPDHQTGFNLLVCYYALDDHEQMRATFTRLLTVPVPGKTVDDEETEDDEQKANEVNEELKRWVSEREKQAHAFILKAAKLVSLNPSLRDWVIESLRQTHPVLASEMEIAKAAQFLNDKQFGKAIDVLKAFEKKDHALKAKASNNLSFLYFLEGDTDLADRYANLAVRNDRYNAKALVNKGNCLFMIGELERAKELFLEAIGVEADCIEAIYNLGLTAKRMGNLDEALQAFEKLHQLRADSPTVIFQIADLYDRMQNLGAAKKWFNILITTVPTDANVLARMGQVCLRDNDENQALHYYLESYRYMPVNLDVISWLGVWYVKRELYERAIEFFQRASAIKPAEVKWRLMVTSCYRRMGAYQKALQLYEEIHNEWPDNVECLGYLVALCRDLGLPYSHYQAKLGKLERTGNVGGQLTQVASNNPNMPRQQQVRQQAPIRMNAISEALPEAEDRDDTEIQHNINERAERFKPREEDVEWGDDADIDDLLAE